MLPRLEAVEKKPALGSRLPAPGADQDLRPGQGCPGAVSHRAGDRSGRLGGQDLRCAEERAGQGTKDGDRSGHGTSQTQRITDSPRAV